MEIVGLVLGAAAVGVTLIALLAALGLILPGPTSRTRVYLETALGRAFVIGLVNLVFFLALALLLLNAAEGIGIPALGSLFGLLAVLIALALILLILAGLAGFTRLVGERIGKAKTSFQADLRGGLLLVLAGLTPIVGWYLFAPFVLASALGAAILALFQKKARA